jgi:protein-S-isoprenylcysteine O-methyltransferase Ste14
MPPPLGRRGVGWVVLQMLGFAAIGVVAIGGSPWPGGWHVVAVVGLVAIPAGAALAVAGLRHLGDALTPFPRPLADGTLRESGVYGLSRHPIYGGLLMLGLGLACWSSPWVLVPLAGLAVVFLAKSVREEEWLTEHYRDYGAYRARVRRRFIPYVW